MRYPNWKALLLLVCLGACRGPESAVDDPQDAGLAEGNAVVLEQLPMTFGERCDIEVRATSQHPGVSSGWTRPDGGDFFIRPKRAVQWVTANGTKSLQKGHPYVVRVQEGEGTVSFDSTVRAVDQFSVSFSDDVQGILVDPASRDSEILILWLITRGYASKVVIKS